MSIEATEPLDLTEEQAEFLLEFYYEAERKIRSSAALAIVAAVARETVLRGDCRISHAEFGRRSGHCRRSIDTAVKSAKRAGLIARVGTDERGIAIYRSPFAASDAHGVA